MNQSIDRHIILKLVLSVSILSTHISYSQITESFENGNLTDNPTWMGSNVSNNGIDFEISNQQLQSLGPTDNAVIYLSTKSVPSLNGKTVTWQIDANYNFPPSSSNYIEWYIMADRPNPDDNTKGYYIRMGKSGSDDGIDFYKIGESQPLIKDLNPTVSSGISTSIRVIRTHEAKWELAFKSIQEDVYRIIGAVIDAEFVEGEYCTIKIGHSKTRNQSYFFDNLSIVSQITDNTPPQLLDVEVLGINQLKLTFDEVLDEISALKTENYTLNVGNDNPIKIEFNEQRVILTFKNNWKNNDYGLTVNNLKDKFDNLLNEQKVTFTFFVPDTALPNDVIITEIMCDPEPSAGLPEQDYIELYNASDKTFDMKDWKVSDAAKIGVLPHYIFLPKTYLLLTGDATFFNSLNNVLSISSFPNFNAQGDDVILQDNNEQIIQSITYNQVWYDDVDKSDGGYSLEIIDLYKKCSDQNNWNASEDVFGGTPGFENSVIAQRPDNFAPKVDLVNGISPDTIRIVFNEPLDRALIYDATINISDPILINDRVLKNGNELFLILSEQTPLITAIKYEISIKNITDCSGNLMSLPISLNFYLIEPSNEGEVIINEVLFNPKPNGVDFVEIYNNSNKYISLKGWSIANALVQKDELIISNSKILTREWKVLSPNAFLVITTNVDILHSQYPNSFDSDVLIVSDLPTYSDDEGIVVLLNQKNVTTDIFQYTETFHSSSIDDNEGVSLERISYDMPTQTSSNWISATSNSGYATPGKQNSQNKEEISFLEESLVIEPTTITPNGDGVNDFSTISYQFNQADNVATMSIYDLNGRLIKTIAKNELLGYKGYYKWEGQNENGKIERMGIYILLFELRKNNGEIHVLKKSIVVGHSF